MPPSGSAPKGSKHIYTQGKWCPCGQCLRQPRTISPCFLEDADHDLWHDDIDLHPDPCIHKLVGIGSGFVVLFGLLTANGWMAGLRLFLASTVATSVTGFGFPFDHLLPSHKVGILSLVVLAIAIPARYAFHLSGSWRWIYVIGAVIALYLNVFVLIVQAFLKVPAVKAMAPTQSEPPFLMAQLAVMALFMVLAIFATKRFHNPPIPTA